MQLSISTSLQQTQLDYSQLTFNQSSTSAAQLPTPPPQDRIRLSDESKRPHDDEHSVRHVDKTHHERKDNRVFDLLKNMLEQISGAQIKDLQKQPDSESSTAVLPQNSSTALSAQQASLSFESKSLSIDGSITTSDGVKLSFELDLQMVHASASVSAFNAGSSQDGYNFSFAGSSAELTSTSFSFSFTAEMPDDEAATAKGLGTFSLKDDLKEFRQTMKPLIKEFLKEAGMPSANQSIKQLLHTIA